MNTDADPRYVVPSQEPHLWQHGCFYQTTGMDLAVLNVWLTACHISRMCVCLGVHAFIFISSKSFQNDLLISAVAVCVRVCVIKGCLIHLSVISYFANCVILETAKMFNKII